MKKTGFLKREGMEKASPLISVAFFKLFSFVMLLKEVSSSFKSLPSIYTCKLLIKLRNVFKQSTIHFIFLVLLFMLCMSGNLFLFLPDYAILKLVRLLFTPFSCVRDRVFLNSPRRYPNSRKLLKDRGVSMLSSCSFLQP